MSLRPNENEIAKRLRNISIGYNEAVIGGKSKKSKMYKGVVNARPQGSSERRKPKETDTGLP